MHISFYYKPYIKLVVKKTCLQIGNVFDNWKAIGFKSLVLVGNVIGQSWYLW